MSASGPTAKVRVLIVDDYHETADTLRILLRLWGYDVLTAYNGPAALETARVFQPHIVLLDLQMPMMHGGELARRLRQAAGPVRPLIIIISAIDEDDERIVPFRTLFDGHLRKPYDPASLQRLLASYSVHWPNLGT